MAQVERHIGQTDPAGGLILGTTDLDNNLLGTDQYVLRENSWPATAIADMP